MNKDQIKGRAKEAKGKIKEVAGKLVNNPTLEMKGTAQKILGEDVCVKLPPMLRAPPRFKFVPPVLFSTRS